MSTVSIICDALGRREIAAAVGVKPSAVSNAVFQGKFPAKWFIVVSGMCEASGLECPADLFAFAVTASTAESTTTTHDTDRGAA